MLLIILQVYQEYIHDRNHVHMNSTQWETLTDFVKWLGKEGHCVVDETEKGWFVQYVDRDPEAIRRQEAVIKKEKMDMDDEERRARFIQQQIEKMKRDEDDDDAPVYTELQRDDDDEKVTFKLPIASASKKSSQQQPVAGTSSAFADLDKKAAGSSRSKQDDSSRKRKSALEEIREMEEMKRKKKMAVDAGEVEMLKISNALSVVQLVNRQIVYRGLNGFVGRPQGATKFCGLASFRNLVFAIRITLHSPF